MYWAAPLGRTGQYYCIKLGSGDSLGTPVYACRRRGLIFCAMALVTAQILCDADSATLTAYRPLSGGQPGHQRAVPGDQCRHVFHVYKWAFKDTVGQAGSTAGIEQ